MSLTKETIRLAFLGIDILRYKELRSSGYVYSESHANAISQVMNDLTDFEKHIDLQLAGRVLTKKYFERWIKSRFHQDTPLSSLTISELFSDHSSLELRLEQSMEE